jgi:hypothetical protein
MTTRTCEADIFWLLASQEPADMSAGERRFLDGRRERILAGIPYLDVPLTVVL